MKDYLQLIVNNAYLARRLGADFIFQVAFIFLLLPELYSGESPFAGIALKDNVLFIIPFRWKF